MVSPKFGLLLLGCCPSYDCGGAGRREGFLPASSGAAFVWLGFEAASVSAASLGFEASAALAAASALVPAAKIQTK